MRVLLTILSSIMLLLVPAVASAQSVVPSERVVSSVRVRDLPAGDPAQEVGRLRPGESAEYLGQVPYYYHVRLTDGSEGYVAKSWTRLIDDGSNSSGEPKQASLELHFIDVGQGDSTLLVCPNGRTALIDAGSTGSGDVDAIADYISDQLHERSGALDYLIVTHPDADHYNLVMEVLSGTPVEHAFYVGSENDYADRAVHAWLQSEPAGHTELSAEYFDAQTRPNSQIDCGDASVWIMAAGVESNHSRKNAMSIVLMVRHGDFEAVLTGDATFATERVIESRYSSDWLDVDLLKVGHHGSLATSTSQRWADLLSPVIAVVSAAENNSYGHPREEVFERLEPHTVTVAPHPFRSATRRDGQRRRYDFVTDGAETEAFYSTATSGNIVVVSNGTGSEVLAEFH